MPAIALLKNTTFHLSALCLFIVANALGQDLNDENTSKSLQSYTPSVLIKKHGFEIKIFNNLYTETQRFSSGQRVDIGSRGTYFTNFTSFLYGISNNRKVNIGADFIFKGVRLDETSASPIALLSFQQSGSARYGISAIGPKIKFVPTEKISGLSVQSAFWIPLIKDSESTQPWLDYHRYTSWTQVYMDRKLTDQFRLFAEIDVYMLLGTKFEPEQFELRLPASLIFSYFPTKKSTVYISNQIFPNLTQKSYFYNPGIGFKYLFTSKFELELLYTNFLLGTNVGAGQTYNLGLRFLK